MLRKLQACSYTQDTDENREYLQKQISPMQNGEARRCRARELEYRSRSRRFLAQNFSRAAVCR
jgi:hypothetical protein